MKKRKRHHVNVLHTPASPLSRVVHQCQTVRQAEKWISSQMVWDSDGVIRGEYIIDPDDHATRAYDRLFARKHK